MAENAAALAMLPFSMAASVMGAFAGPWAAAMDSAMAASRQMASLSPAMPDFTATVAQPATGEVVAFTPKDKPGRAAKVAKPAVEAPVETSLSAELVAEDAPVTPDAVEIVAVEPMIEAPAPIIEETAFVAVVADAAAVPSGIAAVPLAAVPAPAQKPAKAGLLDLVAVDDVQPVDETPAPFVAGPAAMLSPEDFKRPVGMSRPDALDDLKMILGVGPKIEGILHGLGIYSFAQVAAWNAAEIAWVDDYLNFKGRIARDGWIAQADALATGGRDEYVKRFGKEPR
jgi:NADH-quinone oxidoreductase subunit E